MGRGLQVWKFHLKISPWEEKPCLPQVYGPWEASFSSRWLIFGGEEISIPETRPIRKSYKYLYIFSTFYRRGHRRNASEYLPDSAHYRAGYSYQDRENRFQDAAPRNYDLQQGSSASQPSGGPPRYTSNPNLAAAPDVNPEYERPPPYYYPGAAPAGGASGPGPSGAGPSNVPPPLPMPNNRS